ncbi:MAG: 50S ribosomal protein L25 [Chloroflexi bacterium]|nr:50S ribosomal protein L25 [Chloroflexota bacterium]
MATDTVSLSVDTREVTGKKVRALRRTGITPIHLFGGGGESLTLQAETQALRLAVNTAGRGQPISLEVAAGETTLSFVREIAQHPVTGELQHVDFLRVDANKPVQAEVPITIVGEAPATRGGGGQFLRGIRTVLLSVLPLNVPDEIEVSIEGLVNIGDNIRVVDLELPDGVEALSPPDQVIARIAMTRTAAVEAGKGMELEEGAEEAEEPEE